MRKYVEKAPKVSLCRKCYGTGMWQHRGEDGVLVVERCPQCDGTGRVTVSAKMELEIKPYRPKE